MCPICRQRKHLPSLLRVFCSSLVSGFNWTVSTSMALGSFVSLLLVHCCLHLFCLWFPLFSVCPLTRLLALIRAHLVCSLLAMSLHCWSIVGTMSLLRMLRCSCLFRPLQKLSMAASLFGAHLACNTRLSWVEMYVSRSSLIIFRFFSLL